MKIIAVVARKGGVGKTALARELSARLARTAKVLVVNADAQDTLTMVLGMEESPGTSQVLTTDDPVERWMQEAPDSAWRTGEHRGMLYVLPSDDTMSWTGHELINRNPPLTLLRDKLQVVLDAGIVDYVVIDNPPSVFAFAPWLYAACDAAIIPTGGALEGIRGVVKTHQGFELLSSATGDAINLDVIGVVPTQLHRNTNLHRKNWGTMQRLWRGKVWPMIEHRITWQYASQFGQTLEMYAPGSLADEEAETVFQTMLEFVNPTEAVHVEW